MSPFGTMNNGAGGGAYGTMGMPGGYGGAYGANYGMPGYGNGYGTGYGNGYGYGGANTGFYQDSYNAQAARAQNRANRYSLLYDNYGAESRANAGNMRDTATDYQNSGGGYYPPYAPY